MVCYTWEAGPCIKTTDTYECKNTCMNADNKNRHGEYGEQMLNKVFL